LSKRPMILKGSPLRTRIIEVRRYHNSHNGVQMSLTYEKVIFAARAFRTLRFSDQTQLERASIIGNWLLGDRCSCDSNCKLSWKITIAQESK
jgi:hypothetical protein